MKTSAKAGFTLIELVMVTMLLGVLAAIAIPNFTDMRSEAKDGAAQGALGAFRSAIMIARAAIALKEDLGVPTYPTAAEMDANAYDATHPMLNGKAILDDSAGKPANPWTRSTASYANRNKVWDCTSKNKTELLNSPNDDQGWCYNENTGQHWANSDLNGASSVTENNF